MTRGEGSSGGRKTGRPQPMSWRQLGRALPDWVGKGSGAELEAGWGI